MHLENQASAFSWTQTTLLTAAPSRKLTRFRQELEGLPALSGMSANCWMGSGKFYHPVMQHCSRWTV